MANIKAAIVDNLTNTVSNVIIVDDSLENFVQGCQIVPIPSIEIPLTEDEENLYNICVQVDPDFQMPRTYREIFVQAGTTKWTEERGFYEE